MATYLISEAVAQAQHALRAEALRRTVLYGPASVHPELVRAGFDWRGRRALTPLEVQCLSQHARLPSWRQRFAAGLAAAIVGLCHACSEPEANHPQPGACRAG